jgi:hypothetical protein
VSLKNLIMFWKKQRYNLESLKAIENPVLRERKGFNILIIDDDVFPLLDPLRKSGFALTKLEDINDVYELKSFDIIVCDIRGVGAVFESKFAGAHLIKEIYRKYPHKYLIVYSGSTFKVDYNEYFRLADKNVKKGTDLSEWVEILDFAIKSLSNPYTQWERTRKFLQSNDVDPLTISELEQSYIKSILNKKIKFLNRTLNKNKSLMSNEYVAFAMNTLSSFATSIISNLLLIK